MGRDSPLLQLSGIPIQIGCLWLARSAILKVADWLPSNAKQHQLKGNQIDGVLKAAQLARHIHNFWVIQSVPFEFCLRIGEHARNEAFWRFLPGQKHTTTLIHGWPYHPLDPAEPSDVVVVHLLQNALQNCFLAATLALCSFCSLWSEAMNYDNYDESPPGCVIQGIKRLWQTKDNKGGTSAKSRAASHIFIVYTNQNQSKCTSKTKINRDLNLA